MQTTIHLLGHVLQANAVNISVGHDPVVNWDSPDIDLTMAFKIKVLNSQIDITCELNRWSEDLLPHIYMRAFDLSRASVDVVAFAMESGLSVHLHTLIRPDGTSTPLLFNDLRLPSLCSAYNLSEGFDEIHSMVLLSPNLFMAFNDLIQSITLPHKSLVNCARAIERIRNLITPGKGKNKAANKAAWVAMCDALRIDATYLKYITDHSKAPRHGESSHTPGDITNEVVARSWSVMNRYLEYRKAGGVLPSSLPQLTG
ncbi:hypothetical protein [Chromobacterium violaceum]|uniref:hypothetical protein n=1 Tax=Chromobacterium violaceum TaxID=536 RepID=UPI0015FE7DE8|nr:hypothetical protein [Chromobacterium violaceum]MBA8735482.1 hypothetical protein [Chromobacterium violaceum]